MVESSGAHVQVQIKNLKGQSNLRTFQSFHQLQLLQSPIVKVQALHSSLPFPHLLPLSLLAELKISPNLYAINMQNHLIYLSFVEQAISWQEDHRGTCVVVLCALCCHQLVLVRGDYVFVVKSQNSWPICPLLVTIFIYCLNENCSTGLAF